MPAHFCEQVSNLTHRIARDHLLLLNDDSGDVFNHNFHEKARSRRKGNSFLGIFGGPVPVFFIISRQNCCDEFFVFALSLNTTETETATFSITTQSVQPNTVNIISQRIESLTRLLNRLDLLVRDTIVAINSSVEKVRVISKHRSSYYNGRQKYCVPDQAIRSPVSYMSGVHGSSPDEPSKVRPT